MAKHTNKILCGLLALSAGFVLAACDTVNALPANYEQPIVERVGEGEFKLTDNQLGKIWEAVVSGKAEYIHNEIIFQIAESQFGTYFGEGGIASITTDEQIKAFIAAHESVFVREGDSKLAKSEDADVIFTKIRKPRFEAFKEDIEGRLAEKLYSEITSGNYNDKEGRFSELKLALAHYFSGYKIEGVGFKNGVASEFIYDEEGQATTETWFKAYITSSIAKDDLDDIKTVVHVENYQEYLEKKVLRDIYSEKLIEEYVLQNKYTTLGRAYARQASYVKLAYSNENKVFASKLLRHYADQVIYAGLDADEEKVANTWRGLEDLVFDANGALTEIKPGENYLSDITEASERVTIAGRLVEEGYDVADLDATAEEQVALTYTYTKNSKVGALFERYVKACRAVIDGASHIAQTKDQTELDSFTGTNAHSRVKGLKDELSKLVLEDYTADEWGLKNGGFSDLPSNVRERLFNINVANTVDNFTGDNAKYAEDSDEHLGRYATSGVYSYVRDIKEHYYLNKADAQRYVDDHYSFIFDEDSSYVIVNIHDAANSTKLNVDHEKSYFNIKADQPLFTENTAREIAKLLGTKESYKNDAYEHYLEKYNLKFSDQELYDYFVSTYPDLYGED